LFHVELRERLSVRALKPIESGYEDEGSDAKRIASGALWTPPRYALAAPLAPSLAARMEGVAVDLDEVDRYVAANSRGVECTLIETAGGLFSPLNDAGATNLDLIRVLQPNAWILVAADRLGVLSEVGACLRALRGDFRPPDYVLLAGPERDASSATNLDELRRLWPPQKTVALGLHGKLPVELVDYVADAAVGAPQ
jgi:dethiobiotin synthetase